MWILFRHKVKEARASASPPPAASVLLPLQPPPLPSLQSYCQSPHPGVPALRAQKESLHNARHHPTIISDQASAELVAKETAIERVPVVEEEAKVDKEDEGQTRELRGQFSFVPGLFQKTFNTSSSLLKLAKGD